MAARIEDSNSRKESIDVVERRIVESYYRPITIESTIDRAEELFIVSGLEQMFGEVWHGLLSSVKESSSCWIDGDGVLSLSKDYREIESGLFKSIHEFKLSGIDSVLKVKISVGHHDPDPEEFIILSGKNSLNSFHVD